MKARIPALLACLAVALSACSDDSPLGPANPPDASSRYVNAATGDDANPGTSGEPWATITHAVSAADTFATIRVAPGTYSAAGGEVFPIMMRKGQQLIGNVTKKGAGTTETRIQGDGVYELGQMDGAAVVGAEGARIAGFVIVGETNPNFYGGVVVDGVAMAIDHNTFALSYAGVISGNGAGPTVHDNEFSNFAYGLFMDRSAGALVHDNDIGGGSTGIRIHNATNCTIEYNTIRAPEIGVSAQGPGVPAVIRNNSFDSPGSYTFGAIDVSNGSPVIRDNAFTSGPVLWVRTGGAPDMGTSTDAGGNDMTAVSGTVIQHDGTQTVTALGNDWPNEPPIAGDIVITSTGTVVTEW